MPTLRERPNRGDTSPAKKATPNSPSTARSTRKQRSSLPDPIEESIEAKVEDDADNDVEMEDVNSPARVDDEALEQARQEEEWKNTLQLIKDTSDYLCAYTIQAEDGEDYEIAGGFQRLPNKRALPDYFEIITNPMAFSTIRGKLGKKTYKEFKEFVHDVTRICHNAQVYNRPSAPIFSDAGRLLEVFKEKLKEMVKEGQISAADAELPDLGPLPEFEDSPVPEEGVEEMQDEAGKAPATSIGIDYKGETWGVGDWIHLRNSNDPSKPIVAQIFRTWMDASGQGWFKACWYYYPFQTVHRWDRQFFANEVVKTSQFRDHPITDVEGRCQVMFVARYLKGQPRGLPPNRPIYVCEHRYDETRHTFSRIQAWAECLPYGVREEEFQLDPLDAPRHRVASPVKHLLREDAKPTDPLPKPTWRSPNAPP